MAVIVPTAGTLSYNGYTFSAAASTQIKVENILNDGGTTVKYKKYTINVSDFINSNTAGADYSAAEALLLEPAGVLRHEDRGFGDFTVNSTFGLDRDVNGGPFPKFINWTPLSQDQTIFFVWECETIVSPCSNASVASDVAAMEYTIENSRNVDLTAEVTYRGYIEAPQYRRIGTSILAKNVEDYKRLYTPPLQKGYVRNKQVWKLNEKRNRLDFEIVDTEMVEQYPPDIVDAGGSFKVSSNEGSGDSFTGTLQLEFVVAKGASKNAAYLAMREMLAVRFISGEKPTLFTHYDVQEGLFKDGRKMSFNISWLINTSLENLLTTSGIYIGSHFKDTPYRQTKSYGTMESPIYGITKIDHQDVIIGLCDGQKKVDIFQTNDNPFHADSPHLWTAPVESPAYIVYKVKFSDSKNTNVQVNLPTAPTGNSATSGSYSNETGTTSCYSSGEPLHELCMSGAAACVGVPVNVPSVLTVGGKEAIAVGTPVITRWVEEVGGVLVHCAQWFKRFVMQKKPDDGRIVGKDGNGVPIKDMKVDHPMLKNSGKLMRGGGGIAFHTAFSQGTGNLFKTGGFAGGSLGGAFRRPTGLYYAWPKITTTYGMRVEG